MFRVLYYVVICPISMLSNHQSIFMVPLVSCGVGKHLWTVLGWFCVRRYRSKEVHANFCNRSIKTLNMCITMCIKTLQLTCTLIKSTHVQPLHSISMLHLSFKEHLIRRIYADMICFNWSSLDLQWTVVYGNAMHDMRVYVYVCSLAHQLVHRLV